MSRRKDKTQQIIEGITILAYAAEAKCIAKVNDEIIFVQGQVAPGDVCDLKIIRNKKKFKQAQAINIQALSKDHVPVVCEHYGVCGGCKWQHVSYEAQLGFKNQQVKDNLERIAKVQLPAFETISGSSEHYFYRNKLEFTFSQARWLTEDEIGKEDLGSLNALGFHVPGRFDKILEVNNCHLQPEPSNTLRNAVRNFAEKESISFYELKNQKEGALRNLIIRNSSIGEWMVVVQFAFATEEEIGKMMEFIKKSFPSITSLNYVVNQKGNDTFHDLEVINYHGKPFIVEKMENLSFQIGPKSFFQTNSKQALHLYQLVRKYADLKGDEVVYDLYSGTGTIGLFLSNQAKKVVGLEYVEMAVEDAKVNAQINQVENATFFAGDMKKLLTDEFISVHGKPDVIITDPPRAGMDEDVTLQILKVLPKTIVYVSCNPATQARDLAILDAAYHVEVVHPVDMFPQTHHVENIVKLKLR
ncbi:23S rRNA (uracil(1939)-C(5))-methyltransferase RlmD [Sandaracinomonas limnophila]|uniref:23S rRNA (Uracil(1939)-C(5))-methyltransferase RlmD n=1 Tax=Sandaracinomonas limnophila TaxID=1862386 RepID=A0A437PWE1_9BACT|nr:23S rRNA (uracil(1939)-C(5))-methyltransferase RlmD [Sandaracinomonas limnophila]RVU26584.1 23S rRNA (uracil(1939)-C(5))-methyltransferase RlmD [Sandaracinomonas limnophila]